MDPLASGLVQQNEKLQNEVNIYHSNMIAR